MGLAEKFQISIPYSEKDHPGDNTWCPVSEAHVNYGDSNPASGEKFNKIPVTDIECNEPVADFVQGFGGNTDVTSEGGTGVNDPKTFVQGYARREMGMTDDQYGGEHLDLFYGEVVDEKGLKGFAERNNYLDRL